MKCPCISKLMGCEALTFYLWNHEDGQTGMSAFDKMQGEKPTTS